MAILSGFLPQFWALDHLTSIIDHLTLNIGYQERIILLCVSEEMSNGK